MSLWNSILGWFWPDDDSANTDPSSIGQDDAYCTINPATGLPMVGGCGGVDVAGNPFGVDWSHHATDSLNNADCSYSSDAGCWDSSSWNSGTSGWND